MLTKQQVLETLTELPETFRLEDFLDRLIFIEKVEKGLEYSNSNRVISHDEAKQHLKKWLLK
ncbi:MAG: hypothetical protein KF856_09690 [Cyclobacteriaceae bacterium]|nr:hypothetical protein [Cyclobacteriaceae bacterium]